MDWLTATLWIVQGILLFAFAVAGVYVGLRLFAKQQLRLPDAPLQKAAIDAAAPEAEATAPLSSPLSTARSPDAPDVLHAFEFSEDGFLTMVVEMPASLLDNDARLAAAWVDVVGWARVERLSKENEARWAAQEEAIAAGLPVTEMISNDPQRLQEQLDKTLHRLQLSAERRRQLRALLEQSLRAQRQEG